MTVNQPTQTKIVATVARRNASLRMSIGCLLGQAFGLLAAQRANSRRKWPMPATINARKIGPPIAPSDVPRASRKLIDGLDASAIHQKTPARIAYRTKNQPTQTKMVATPASRLASARVSMLDDLRPALPGGATTADGVTMRGLLPSVDGVGTFRARASARLFRSR